MLPARTKTGSLSSRGVSYTTMLLARFALGACDADWMGWGAQSTDAPSTASPVQ
jgi:hypothetical protein